jgi:hypothetical protein
MAWKNIYWFYVLLALLLVVGIIVALVLGLNSTNNNNNKKSEEAKSVMNPLEKSDIIPSTDVNLGVENIQNLMNGATNFVKSNLSEIISVDHITNEDQPKNEPDKTISAETPVALSSEITEKEDTTTNITPTTTFELSEEIVKSSLNKPIPWTLKSELEIPRNISPSFGYSVTSISDLILVGAPMDDTYGRIFAYNTSETDGLKEIYDIPFSFVGSPYQRAGSALCQHIVAAPEFSIKTDRTKAQEGTLFIIDDLEETSVNPTCRRLSTHLNDGFHMVKYGQIFTYQKPYIYVTKRKIGHQCVDIFEMSHDGSIDLKFIQRIEDQDQVEDLFGHHIAVTKDNNRLVISDPFTNNFRVYIRQNQVWTLLQIINVASEYEDKEDLEQSLCLSEDGSKLIIGSSDNEKVLVFLWQDSPSANYQKCQTLSLGPNGSDIKIGFGTNVVLSANGDMLAVCETGDGKRVHVFMWSNTVQQFDLHEEILIGPHMPHIAMNSYVVWKGQDLFVCGLSEVNHNGKLLWFHKLQNE